MVIFEQDQEGDKDKAATSKKEKEGDKDKKDEESTIEKSEKESSEKMEEEEPDFELLENPARVLPAQVCSFDFVRLLMWS
ncbi:26S proteasome non-ATPase regulatory subunit 1-like [Orbicella faveolata]|uniref:26S proteasome non-ATPase regulatory subunit 1-like n=1 Tax=Orbicella faveolata TaxID=48498 RepID=UPI0009E45343|nr:26S proteasome non-ATPase regulatory subunit 1-like [Orbicella faveolata]